jgi:4'-phosphopantetheinyl transferase
MSPMLVTDSWVAAPAILPQHQGDAQVWWIDVPRWRSHLPMLRRLLARDERARADSFRCQADADRLTVGRGVLRLLLGEFLRIPPEQVPFGYSAAGKPSTVGLEFNVAHSGDVVLIATHSHPVGIDVERVDRVVDIASVSRDCFTARERAFMFERATAQEEFFRLWTRKEAWLKAVGTGLSFPPLDIDVADPAAPVIAPGAAIDGTPPSRIVDLPSSPGYAAACAISGPECHQVRLWRLEQPWRRTARNERPSPGGPALAAHCATGPKR